jgi:ribonuclease PH
MRNDGRKPDEMRPVRITPNFIPTAEGSVLLEVGDTRVICTASVDSGVPHWMRGAGKGWLTAEYSMLPRSTLTRTPRESTRGRISGRTHEIQRLIGRSLRGVIDLDAIPDRTVLVDCDVVQADGGTRTASITGAFLALSLAFNAMVARGDLRTSPLLDYIGAISVGIVNGEALLDLNYDEDSRADVDMNIVMTGKGQFIEVQATAEHAPFDDPQLASLIGLGRNGVAALIERERGVAAIKNRNL